MPEALRLHQRTVSPGSSSWFQGRLKKKCWRPWAAALLPESRQHISGAEHTLHIMEQAPVNLFIINPLGLDLDSPATPEQRIYEICNAQSIGAAVENMTLAAEGLGLGSLWICDIFFAYRELNQWLGVQGTLTAAMALGYADEAPGPRPRKSMDDLAAWRS